METLTISGFARAAGVKPSFVTQLINAWRIPEAVRGEDERYRVPNRRCVIPSKYGKKDKKIDKFSFRRDEIPQEWIDDPSTRPGTADESGHFVGTELEGEEGEPLASRIERTFGVEVGPSREDLPSGDGASENGESGTKSAKAGYTNRGLFPNVFIDSPARVVLSGSESVLGTLVDVDERGVVLNREGEEADGTGEPGATRNGGITFCFVPWESVLFIEARIS